MNAGNTYIHGVSVVGSVSHLPAKAVEAAMAGDEEGADKAFTEEKVGTEHCKEGTISQLAKGTGNVRGKVNLLRRLTAV